ncbi:hypothetical protein [Parafrigoribacterium humi]|uniref:hypothetical protein n=1 Tax=Parafrigoribacterium humi TaxID=3144664 RepID=UPI0032F063C6
MAAALALAGGMTLAGVTTSASAETTPPASPSPGGPVTTLDSTTVTPPTAVAQTCSSEGLLVDGYIATNGTSDITYTIVGTAPNTFINIPNAPAKSVVPPGEYRVTVASKSGKQIDGDSGPWLRTVQPFAGTCEFNQQLPTDADWTANARATSQSCSAGGVASGYISVDFVQEPGFQDRVQYFVGATELTSSRTDMAPGTYTVTAKPRVAGDGVQPSSWTVTIGAVDAAICGQLTTLPFTGPADEGGVLILAIGLLAAGTALCVSVQARRRGSVLPRIK